VSEICEICGRSHPNERLPMSNAEHRPDCLFVRDGGRSICTCWPETQLEREQLKQTTMNDLGSILGRCEIRLQHIENKIDALGEAFDARTDRIISAIKNYENAYVAGSLASQMRDNELSKKLDKIISALIDQQPKFQPVRRATKKGKRR
jgi:hypothetical protein